MGTRTEPGEYDCYSRALPDEPLFILLGRDQCAPQAVAQWCTAREAMILHKLLPQSDLPMLAEARRSAAAMVEWRRANDGAWRRPWPGPDFERFKQAVMGHELTGVDYAGHEGRVDHVVGHAEYLSPHIVRLVGVDGIGRERQHIITRERVREFAYYS